MAVGLIVDELATNAVELAIPDRRGRIALGFRRRDTEVVPTVSDDGVGLGQVAGSCSSGLGSRFVDAFVRQVGGTTATAKAKEGTTFTVRLPASILAEV